MFPPIRLPEKCSGRRPACWVISNHARPTVRRILGCLRMHVQRSVSRRVTIARSPRFAAMPASPTWTESVSRSTEAARNRCFVARARAVQSKRVTSSNRVASQATASERRVALRIFSAAGHADALSRRSRRGSGAVPARDRARLERLCRYVCRPPIAQQRLEEHPSGELRYAFKKPWKGRHRRAPTRAARSDRACAPSCLHLGCTWCATTACSARTPRLEARSCPIPTSRPRLAVWCSSSFSATTRAPTASPADASSRPRSATKSAWRRLPPASAGARRPLPRVQAGRSAVRVSHPRRFSSFEIPIRSKTSPMFPVAQLPRRNRCRSAKLSGSRVGARH